ncbi:MAG: lipoyl(octanoyl) transferase LipB [Candidatus Thermoplasmatota archaeon]|nr:lipoyl(octanoyl) transferase LipB [Candidatus Thermoplasmatota archaeon]
MPAEILDLGRVDYREAWDLMQRMRLERKEGRRGDTLLLVEHPPVFTVGVQGGLDAEEVDGVPVFHIERGGLATYHGPGQIVGYPIVDLTPRGRDVRAFVHALEEMVARTLEPFGIQGRRVEGKRGVWVGDKKIASVGIAVRDWVTYHGFALNVATDLSYFEKIHPCGFEGKIMTSMQQVLNRTITPEEVKPVLKGTIGHL